MRSWLARADALRMVLAAALLLAPLAGRTDDAGTDDAGTNDTAADAGGDGGIYTMSGSAESGCTCAASGSVSSAGSGWSTQLGLLIGLLNSPR